MLSVATPLRGLVLLLGLTVAIAVWPAPRPPSGWQLGYVERGSLRVVPGGYLFRLSRVLGSDDTTTPVIDVVYGGILPDTVCEGQDVVIEGQPGTHGFEASTLHGFHNGRYDRCWRARCDRAAYARCHGTQYE